MTNTVLLFAPNCDVLTNSRVMFKSAIMHWQSIKGVDTLHCKFPQRKSLKILHAKVHYIIDMGDFNAQMLESLNLAHLMKQPLLELAGPGSVFYKEKSSCLRAAMSKASL